MAKKNEDFSCISQEILGSLKESNKSPWTKSVLRVAWGENSPTIDIRQANLPEEKLYKGINLTNEETDRLVDILLDNDYGSIEKLEEVLTKRKSVYTDTIKGIEFEFGIGDKE